MRRLLMSGPPLQPTAQRIMQPMAMAARSATAAQQQQQDKVRLAPCQLLVVLRVLTVLSGPAWASLVVHRSTAGTAAANLQACQPLGHSCSHAPQQKLVLLCIIALTQSGSKVPVSCRGQCSRCGCRPSGVAGAVVQGCHSWLRKPGKEGGHIKHNTIFACCMIRPMAGSASTLCCSTIARCVTAMVSLVVLYFTCRCCEEYGLVLSSDVQHSTVLPCALAFARCSQNKHATSRCFQVSIDDAHI